MKDKIIISLTTIPSRINNIEPVLKSLLNQYLEPSYIYLNIPKNYNRFNEPIVIPDFIQKYDKVKVNYIENDYGPATKFIGTLESNSIDPDDIIVITDDDIVKERHWLSGLLLYFKSNSVITYEEKNLGKGIVWGYLGYGFRKGLIDLTDLKKFYDNVKEKCFLVDDHWLTAYITSKKFPVITVSIKNNKEINKQSIDSKDSLVNLEGNEERWHVSEHCRKHIKDKLNIEFPFWCCMGCCKKGVRKKIFEGFSNNNKSSKFYILILLTIIFILFYFKEKTIKIYSIIVVLILTLLYSFAYRNKVENFDNKYKEISGIPKVIIQTYYQKNKIPNKVYENIKKFAPEYEHIIYDDPECEDFLSKNFNPIILSTFKELKGAHKADLFRYCYLYKNGGIYLDIKTELIKPVSELFPNNYTYTVMSIIKNSIYQGIIATPPNNPIFLKLIFFMVKIVNRKKDFPYIIFTVDFFHKIYDYCGKKPQLGLNIGKNGFDYYLFQEKCNKDKNNCSDGLDRYGLCCYICDNDKKLIKSRYADFPW